MTMTIWMDDREPEDYVALFNQLGYWVDYERIPEEIGYDYVWNNVGIERKAINDLMSSAQADDKHLWSQLNRMSDDDYFSYLIIDGKVYEELDYSRYDYKEFYGTKGSINTRYVNVRVDTAHNGQAFCYLVHKIFKSHQEGKHGKERPVMKSYAPKLDAQAEVLTLVDNMKEKAVDISRTLELDKLHDICELVDRKKDVTGIKGVGIKTYENIVKKFNLDK